MSRVMSGGKGDSLPWDAVWPSPVVSPCPFWKPLFILLPCHTGPHLLHEALKQQHRQDRALTM